MTAKTLERILILRTMLNLDPRGDGISGIHIADRASIECDHVLLEDLPPVSRRGIGQKLNAMSLAGLVRGDQRICRRPARSAIHVMHWSITATGRELAESIGARS